ncbi:MAG: VTC domain-containing protein [Myxococcaceae bacterium]|nr:VTC domain-containing protein [Myxococcaceae bacterium]MCI0672953.1 VTC domain-containing protein [Myxococcaceae bacterium]
MLAHTEGPVTRLRREFKLLVPAEVAQLLCMRLLRESPPSAFQPPAHITSVYFDRPDLALAARAARTPHDCLKVRTKEYFPDLQAPEQRRVVLEVKHERNGLTHKRRVWVPRSELGQVLNRGVRLLPLIAGGSLQPYLAVTYRRRVFQQCEAWRVTVDDQIAFHRVTPMEALSAQPLTLRRLPAPASVEAYVVVEVKHLGEALPGWIAALEARRASRYSKFAEGMGRLHGLQLGVVGQGG